MTALIFILIGIFVLAIGLTIYYGNKNQKENSPEFESEPSLKISP